ncbi:TetR/AcrR family transcriptional regulator [Streptomyces sp. P38-E01]|uniref:TetR/AcrR family transcriptional regulator n=1 Tax=Streptomyces tardus TaxID=2780544 RepID=A0A949JG51_9ACTN|nr:TetR/AcrR family transcriptional regulator [Streptomyces tardus]
MRTAPGSVPAAAQPQGKPRQPALRVDAQRNLEHVLRAAREVFGEVGYGAPMEDVARRARVGVGTVYRRFPSKDVLVRRIAQEETARLAEQARSALAHEGEGWPALAGFLRSSVASGAGRLLPPHVLAAEETEEGGVAERAPLSSSEVASSEQGGAAPGDASQNGSDISASASASASAESASGAEVRVPGQRSEEAAAEATAFSGEEDFDPFARELLAVVGELVDRARAAGALRDGVSVSDVLLVIATAAPSLPDLQQRSAASDRLLEILLAGLRTG